MNNSSELDFLDYVIRSIIDDDSSLTIEKVVDEMGVLYTVRLDKAEAGKIIGKDGQIAKAIRLVLKAVGYKYKVRASMKVEAND